MADEASLETDPETEPAPPAVERPWRPAAPTTNPSPDAEPDPDAGPEPASDDSPSDGPSAPEAERSSEGSPADRAGADTSEGHPPTQASPEPPAEVAPAEEDSAPSGDGPAPDDVPGADAPARDAAPSDDGSPPDATAPAPSPPSAPDDEASAPPDGATDGPPAAPSPEQAAGSAAPEDGGTGDAPQDPPPDSPADASDRPVTADADSQDEVDAPPSGGTTADGGDADAASPDPPPAPDAGNDGSPTEAPPREDTSEASAPDDALPPDTADPAGPELPEQEGETDSGRAAAEEEGKRINEEAFSDAEDPSSWTDRLDDADRHSDPSRSRDADRKDFYTDQRRGVRTAEQIEEEVQDFVYEVNEGTAGTDWTPSEVEARRTAAMFAILVSKVAEDMSYQRRPGDEFWDPRKIMRRQIDNRPLRHCKMDYTKRRLALLVDTSPSCRDEAVFYSKIASGAMLRDDIDIFLCPNGRIDARFDPEPMRFVDDDRGADWGLDGRTVLYFTDWDGADEIVTHSRACTLYWFDNCPPADYWESARDRYQRVRLRYRGRHFHCPGPDAFQRLARKIRP